MNLRACRALGLGGWQKGTAPWAETEKWLPVIGLKWAFGSYFGSTCVGASTFVTVSERYFA